MTVRPEPSPTTRGRPDLAGAIYGTLLSTAVVAGFSEEESVDPLEIAIAVLVTGFVFWLAHVYAAVLPQGYSTGRRATGAEMRGRAVQEWPMVQAAVPPVLVLLLGSVGALSKQEAVTVAIALGVLALFGWGLVIGGREGLGRLARVGVAVVDAVFGLAIVLLKVLVH
jgi:hypothetical protein